MFLVHVYAVSLQYMVYQGLVRSTIYLSTSGEGVCWTSVTWLHSACDGVACSAVYLSTSGEGVCWPSVTWLHSARDSVVCSAVYLSTSDEGVCWPSETWLHSARDSVVCSAVCNHVRCPLCCAVAYLSTSGRRVSVDPVRHDYTVEDALCLILTSALGEECSFLICKV